MWGIGAVVAAVLAIVFWMSMKSSAPAVETATQPQAQADKSSGSLAALVSRGATVQCSVDNSTGAEVVKGTVYVSGKNVRGDFETTMPQKGVVESHMIKDGDYMYVWSSAMPQGMKMKATPPQQTDTGPKPAPAADLYNKNYDYNCSPWRADASKFTLPTDIKFMDVSEMMKGIPMPPVGAAGGAAVKPPAGMNCSACDQAPATAKAQCRAALGCK